MDCPRLGDFDDGASIDSEWLILDIEYHDRVLPSIDALRRTCEQVRDFLDVSRRRFAIQERARSGGKHTTVLTVDGPDELVTAAVTLHTNRVPAVDDR